MAALYRKYRPQSFADVVGQEAVVRTLSNAITGGTVRQAYLFAGPRGTGKTSMARILAKSLNCAQGPTTTPDGTCHVCTTIASPRPAPPSLRVRDMSERAKRSKIWESAAGSIPCPSSATAITTSCDSPRADSSIRA